jgi:hypothetical protein
VRHDPNTRVPGYQGTLERPKPLLEFTALHPYAAEITVTAMPYRGVDKQKYEIAASWFGPTMSGAPPADGPVHSNDLLLVDDELIARGVAYRARNALARGEVPDLFVLSGQVRRTPITPISPPA